MKNILVRTTLATGAMLLFAVGGALAQPTMSNQGGRAGGANMNHSQMGGPNVGGPTGGTITGNSGTGGPAVQHGHAPAPAPRRTN